jgi:hypothetical protein
MGLRSFPAAPFGFIPWPSITPLKTRSGRTQNGPTVAVAGVSLERKGFGLVPDEDCWQASERHDLSNSRFQRHLPALYEALINCPSWAVKQ